MSELHLGQDNIILEVFALRDQSEDFVVVAKGKRAATYLSVVPFYERFRDAYRAKTPGRRRLLWSFAWRALPSPTFWSLCILADFEASSTKFSYSQDVLKAEFHF